jgi:hypothetical protein
MGTITINGGSDDLVEVGGDLVEEFSPADTDEFLVLASDGTILKGSYDGVWRFVPHTAGTATMSKVEAPEDDDDNYSDVVTLAGNITWVAIARPNDLAS